LGLTAGAVVKSSFVPMFGSNGAIPGSWRRELYRQASQIEWVLRGDQPVVALDHGDVIDILIDNIGSEGIRLLTLLAFQSLAVGLVPDPDLALSFFTTQSLLLIFVVTVMSKQKCRGFDAWLMPLS
jgi:hypothetical protein